MFDILNDSQLPESWPMKAFKTRHRFIFIRINAHTFICQYTTIVYKWLKIKEQNEAAKAVVYNWIYKY